MARVYIICRPFTAPITTPQDADGQIPETRSISTGLNYPGVGPEHSWLKDTGRADYVAVTDTQAIEALQLVASTEDMVPALKPSHAIYHAMQVCSFCVFSLFLVDVACSRLASFVCVVRYARM